MAEAYAGWLSVEADVNVVAVIGLREPVRVGGAVRVEAVDELGRLLAGRQCAELSSDRAAGPLGRDVGAGDAVDRCDVHGAAVVVVGDVAAGGELGMVERRAEIRIVCCWLIAPRMPRIRGSIEPDWMSTISSEFESSTLPQLIGALVGPGRATEYATVFT